MCRFNSLSMLLLLSNNGKNEDKKKGGREGLWGKQETNHLTMSRLALQTVKLLRYIQFTNTPKVERIML